MDAPNEVDTPPPPSTWVIGLAFGLLFLTWGTTYYATGYAMKEGGMPPALFGGIRLILAGTILLGYQAACGRSLRLSLLEAGQLLLIALCLFLGANLLITIGQKTVESGVAAILIATTPLFMGLFAMLWPKGERLSWIGWIGLLIGLAGIVLTLAPKIADGIDLVKDLGPLLMLGSAAAWAIGSLFSRQMGVKLPHLTSAGFQMLFGVLCQFTVCTCIGEWPVLIEKLSWGAVAAFLYLLVAGSLIGFVAFNWLLGHVSAAKVGTYAYINPIIAVFIGWITNETEVHAWLIPGIAVILGGVYLVRRDHVPGGEIEVEPD